MSTNVPGQKGTIRLTIQGEIWQPVDVKPLSARFGRLTPDAAQSASLLRKLTIVNNMETDATLKNVRCTNPSYRAQTSVIEPGKKFELTVSVVAPLQPGDNRGKVQMSTGIVEKPTLSVPISAYLMSDVDVYPKVLTLRRGQQRGLKRKFIVTNNTKKPLKINELEVSNPAINVELQETKPGTMFKIVVDIPSGYEPAPGGDKITFKTDCPTAPVVTIPINGGNYPSRARAGKAGASGGARLPGGTPQQKGAASATTGLRSKPQDTPAKGTAKTKDAKPAGG